MTQENKRIAKEMKPYMREVLSDIDNKEEAAEIGIDRNKPIFFGCFNCRKASDIPITITLENPYKHEQPNWQTTWACDVCVKKLFKELGPDLVIL